MIPGRHEGERGQTLVEFAFAILMFFSVMFGVIDFGRAFYAYDLVTSAARLGTRYAAVRGSSCTFTGCPATAAAIQTYVQSSVNGIDTSQLNVVPTWSTQAGGTCPAETPGCYVNVTVTYPFRFLILSALSAVTMTGSSQMIISQ